MANNTEVEHEFTTLRNVSKALFEKAIVSSSSGTVVEAGLGTVPSVYLWDKTSPPDGKQRRYFLSHLLTSMISGDTDFDAWRTWVYSLVSLAIPAIGTALANKSKIAPLYVTSEDTTALTASIALYLSTCDTNTGDQAESGVEIPLEPHPGMPTWANSSGSYYPNAQYYSGVSDQALLGAISIIIFLMGKRVTAVNLTSISEKRPRALISKYHLDDESYFLTGNGKLGWHAISMVGKVWAVAYDLRRLTLQVCADYESIEDPGMDAIITTVRLLKWSGLTFLGLIHTLIVELPWIITEGYLRSSLLHYQASLTAMAGVSEKIQPYIKVMMGDRMMFFVRQKMNPLIACAITYGLRTQPTLSNYAMPPNSAPIIELFTQSMAEHNVPLLLLASAPTQANPSTLQQILSD